MLCLFGYWLTAARFRSKERSIRALVEGDGVFDTDSAVKILGGFQGEPGKLEALKVLANHDSQKAARLLQKVKDHVDLTRFNAESSKTRLQQLKVVAAALLAFGTLGLIYSLAVPQSASTGDSVSRPAAPATDRGNQNLPPIIINNTIAALPGVDSRPRAQSAPITDPPPAAKPMPTPAEKPAPRAASEGNRVSTQNRSLRCESLLQRSSLGDELNAEEQIELRNCI